MTNKSNLGRLYGDDSGRPEDIPSKSPIKSPQSAPLGEQLHVPYMEVSFIFIILTKFVIKHLP